MSVAFDEGGSSGLLLNNLRCVDDRQSFILDSSSDITQVDNSVHPFKRKLLDMTKIKGELQNKPFKQWDDIL